MNIGQQILSARGKRGLSQTALAAKAGVSRATVARVELGTPISVTTLDKILKALNLEIKVTRAKRCTTY